MSELQRQIFLDLSSTTRLERDDHIETSINRSRKKIKLSTMTASAEERLTKAKAFVEKDIADHKVG